MFSATNPAAIALAVALCACARAERAVPVAQEDGWLRYQESRMSGTLSCPGKPILLAGSRLQLRLSGGCQMVRVAGEHSDVYIEVAPGGTIEITGNHNDVTWVLARSGGTPRLIDGGSRNTFHAAAGPGGTPSGGEASSGTGRGGAGQSRAGATRRGEPTRDDSEVVSPGARR
jgi:hypothetical protein